MSEWKQHHMCADIQGLLRQSDKMLHKLFKLDDGSKPTGQYAREFLKLKLAKGWKVFPMDGCDNFDPQTGCKGHAMPEYKIT